jgi:uncharacterized membrane protein (Fun14 family)
MIIISSTIKGLITGVIAGWVARATNSVTWAVVVGVAVGLVLSYLAALGSGYYLQIMLPGTILGAIAGFASQRFGRVRSATANA